MIKCPHCQTKHPENAVLCNECGAYLRGDVRKDTDPVVVAGVTRVDEEMDEAPEKEVTLPLSLKLTIPDSGYAVEVPLSKEVSIGRLDETSASVPDVDLSRDGGLEKGVSRRHAKIARRGNKVFVEDLGSLNGTLLNCKKLVPYLPHVLKSGDKLQLGKLALRIGFTK